MSRPLICDGCCTEITNRKYVGLTSLGYGKAVGREICESCYKRVEELFGW